MNLKSKSIWVFEGTPLVIRFLKLFGGTQMTKIQSGVHVTTETNSIQFYRSCMEQSTFFEESNSATSSKTTSHSHYASVMIQKKKGAETHHIPKNASSTVVNQDVTRNPQKIERALATANLGSIADNPSTYPLKEQTELPSLSDVFRLVEMDSKDEHPWLKNSYNVNPNKLNPQITGIHLGPTDDLGKIKNQHQAKIKSMPAEQMATIANFEPPSEDSRKPLNQLPVIEKSPEWTYNYDQQYQSRALSVTSKLLLKMDHQDAADFVHTLEPFLIEELLKANALPTVVQGIVMGKKNGVRKLNLTNFLDVKMAPNMGIANGNKMVQNLGRSGAKNGN